MSLNKHSASPKIPHRDPYSVKIFASQLTTVTSFYKKFSSNNIHQLPCHISSNARLSTPLPSSPNYMLWLIIYLTQTHLPSSYHTHSTALHSTCSISSSPHLFLLLLPCLSLSPPIQQCWHFFCPVFALSINLLLKHLFFLFSLKFVDTCILHHLLLQVVP